LFHHHRCRHLCGCFSVFFVSCASPLEFFSYNSEEQSAIAVYLVSDAIDRCRVGFLPRHLLKHWKRYDRVLAQITDVHSKDSASPTNRREFYHKKGCCVAAIISSLSDDTVKQLSSQKRRAEPDDEDSPTKRTKTAAEGEFHDNAAQTSQPT
jgi:hypothetical protein